MCNALSPEKAVIWTVLHDRAPDGVCGDDFTHPVYRVWFEAVCQLKHEKRDVMLASITTVLREQNHDLDVSKHRALKRLLKIKPPQRICKNAQLLGQALKDRRAGRAVHIERLIN